jgi:predicted Zn-dependent peptidase
MINIKVTEIKPGFSIVTETMPNLESASIGIFFSCGSRFESESEQGINHLIEHMFFKGTDKRNAGDIAKFAEGNGAVIDGFTTKETSGIYCRYFAKNLDDITSLIDEIITSSKFDPDLIEKEKNIIFNEISDSEDNPHEYLFELLNRALFDKHPLAHPISGTIDTVDRLSTQAVRDYYYEKFLTSRVCISAAGKIDHNQLLDKLQIKNNRLFASKPNLITKPDINIPKVRIMKSRTDLSQLYAAAADFTFSYRDEERYGMILLNNIWGGSMSSRLFHRVREQEGLVYSIFSFIDLYSDIGLMGAFYISDPKNQSRVFECGYEETIKLKEHGVTQSELERAINYCKSLLVLGSEDPMSRMIRNAKHQLLLNRMVTIEESIAQFEKYDIDTINELTKQLPLNYSVVNVSPVDQSDEIKKSGGPQNVVRDQ